MDRIEWDDLPASLRNAIDARTGPIVSGSTIATGQNSPLAAVVQTHDHTRFVKGIPVSEPRYTTLDREASVASLIKGISPSLRDDYTADGYKILVFDYLKGRPADYRPESADIPLILTLMERLASIAVPEDHSSVKTADRWKHYADDLDDIRVLTGSALIHTDWKPDNVLIADGRAWLVDWAYATRAAAWIDPACWVLWLIASGHPPEEAEAWGRFVRSYARARGTDIDTWARVSFNLWHDIAKEHQSPWVQTLARAARTWCAYRKKLAGDLWRQSHDYA